MDNSKQFFEDHDIYDPGPEFFFFAILSAESALLADLLSSHKKLRRNLCKEAAHLCGALWVVRRLFVPHDFPSDYGRV